MFQNILQATSNKYRYNRYFLSLVLFLLISIKLNGQELSIPFECTVVDSNSIVDSGGVSFRPPLETSCSKSSNIFNSFYRLQNNFIPENGLTRPATVTKKVKIRFIVLEENNTANEQMNFRPSNLQDLNLMVQWLNGMMSNLSQPTNPVSSVCGSCRIVDERFRVELAGVDFVNSNLANNPVSNSDSVLNVYLFVDTSKHDHSPTAQYPNLHFGGAWTSLGGALVGPGNPSTMGIFMFNTYLAGKEYPIMVDPNATFNDILWNQTLRLMHELHHCLGLGHLQTNSGNVQGFDPAGCSGLDFLEDAFPNGCPMSFGDDSTINIMNASDWGNYLSPLQIGRAHRSSFLGRVSKYLYPTESPNEHPWLVQNNEIWDFPIRMFQDIVIDSGATLTIKCLVQMPSKGIINVRKGGKLIIDGGHVTSYNSSRTWEGIETEGQPHQPSNSIFQGTVIIKNGAIIERAERGVKNYLTRYCKECRFGAVGGGGGIINATNSWFYNCARAVKLAYYPDYYYPSGNCEFVADSFIWDDPNFKYDTAGMITTWDIRGGLNILHCTFKNEISRDLISHSKRGLAVNMESTSAFFLQNNFDGFYGGIFNENYSGLPNRVVQVYNNKFNHITANIMYGASGFGEIKGNHFTNIYGWESGEYEGDIPVNNNYGYAIYLDNSSGSYVGCNNLIYGTTDQQNGNSLMRYGVIVNNSQKYNDIVVGNSFYDLPIGIQTQRNNPNLTLYCNNHVHNGYAWAINPQSTGNQYYLNDQGNGCQSLNIRAHNSFNNNYIMDIASYLNNTWKYYTWNTSNGQYPNNHSGSVNVNNCNGNGVDANEPCINSLLTSCSYRVYAPGTIDSLITKYKESSNTEINQNLLFSEIIRGYSQLNDNLGLLQFLENERTDKARKLLIPLYIDQGLFSKVNKTIDSLQLNSGEKQGYLNYYSILANLKQNNRQIFDLTESEKISVVQIANSSLEVSPFAKALMDFVYGEKWVHPIEAMPLSAESYKPLFREIDNQHSMLYNAVPNPANEQTIISIYISPQDILWNPELVIYNNVGGTVLKEKLKKERNEIKINTHGWVSGLYFYCLNIKDKIVKVKKLSIIK